MCSQRVRDLSPSLAGGVKGDLHLVLLQIRSRETGISLARFRILLQRSLVTLNGSVELPSAVSLQCLRKQVWQRLLRLCLSGTSVFCSYSDGKKQQKKKFKRKMFHHAM